MDFQFHLPAVVGDLLNSSGDNYYVQHVYSPVDILEKLKACKRVLYENDPFYLFDHFDSYYSVIHDERKDGGSLTNLMRAFDLLYQTLDKLGQRLSLFLSTSEMKQERNSYLNLTKMTLFLFVNTVKKIDQIMLLNKQDQSQNVQKKRGKQTEMFAPYGDWGVKRGKFLLQLFNVLQSPLEKLWNPPVVEESFVNLICDICYRTLEMMDLRTDRHVSNTAFQIFGTAIKRYNHAITFPVRILQILRTTEHAAVSIAAGIHILHVDYNITSIFSVLIKDIVDALALDSADTAVSRNFSSFLMELASINTKLMIPHLSTLCDELLNCESHVLRNCVLQIMGDAIMGELTSEELSEELKEARNEFLENLLAHINDVSAHVRSRVLQIWHSLKEENAVPLCFQLKVICVAVERLEDKTATVRKQAILLIKAFLERNPFAAKLSLKELVKKHADECEQMERLTERLAQERKRAEQLDEQWSLVIPTIFPQVEAALKSPLVEDVVINSSAIIPENYEDMVCRISTLLLEKKYSEAVTLVRKADQVAGNAELRHTLRLEEQCAYYMALLKSYMFLANGCKDSNEELGTQIKTVQFLQDSVEFSKAVTKAVPKLQEMLLSKTNSDVFEAVDLFTTGYLFGIKGTECGMRNMLSLVWSSDKEKRDAVSNAYKKVIFATDQSGRANAFKVVHNLSVLLSEMEYGHFTALECLVREWVTNDDIDALVIQVLFERFAQKLEGTTDEESRLALQLLIMCSASKSSIASANVAVIETIGFGGRAERDPRIFTLCLEFLLNSIDSPTGVSAKFYQRYEPDAGLPTKVRQLFLSFFFHPHLPTFDQLAMRTVEFFYRQCQKPDLIAQGMLQELVQHFIHIASLEQTSVAHFVQCTVHDSLKDAAELLPQLFSQPMPESQQPLPTIETEDQPKLVVYLLTRFIFLVGYMTLKELIFLDIDAYNNMKYRQELTECEQKKKDAAVAASQHLMRRSNAISMSATASLKRLSGTAAEPQQEPDEDLVGATAEDTLAELINHICEDVLVHADDALLTRLLPYILEICRYPGKYRDKGLQQAATLTLIRCMCVSSRICAVYMPFLMNVLQNTKNLTIKCSIVIGLSDLTFRFPNIIEPWTGHFYSTLHEQNKELRLTAVKMLSHLILHEMIRVKGQIADMAMCIVDEDEDIKYITQQFFKEIANKSNILYNVLPDIISKLSDTNAILEEEKYRTIMRYILGLIQKDRQVETLVEKLCQRFPVTREERQWRDISYCLSLLSYNERSLRKLIDNVQHFKDKVQIDEVYQSFRLIIANTSRLAKPELKTMASDLETRINECMEVNNCRGEATSDDSIRTGDIYLNGASSRDNRSGRTAKVCTTTRHRQVVQKNRIRRADTSELSSSSNSDGGILQKRERRIVGSKRAIRPKPRGQRTTSSSTSCSDDDNCAEGKRPPPVVKQVMKRNTARSINKNTHPKVVHTSDTTEEIEEQVPLRKRGRNSRLS